MSPDDKVVVSWRVSQKNQSSWMPEITLGYEGQSQHDHIAIPLAELSTIISEMKIEMRVARLKAHLKNLEDNPVGFLKQG